MSNVTVVIPTYNGERFVAEAVQSVARQSAPPRQIIVVDDYSTDATVEKVKQIAAASDLPIRLIELPRNSGGPARPINVGVAAASTEWVAVLDQDDLYMDDALMRLSGLLEQNPQLGCAAMLCGCYPQGPTLLRSSVLAEILASGRARDGWCEIPPEACLRQILLHGQFLVGYPGFMFRRKLWAAKGGVCESLKIASDVEFLCWICSRCPIGLIAEMGYLRREHDANVCRQRLNMEQEDILVRTRYAQTSRKLRHDSRVRDVIARESSNVAYELRCRGQYWRAGAWYLRSLLRGRINSRAIGGMVKLLPHWLLTRPGANVGPALVR